jgi:hypothetical protein
MAPQDCCIAGFRSVPSRAMSAWGSKQNPNPSLTLACPVPPGADTIRWARASGAGSRQAGAEHFQQCDEFVPLRNSSLRPFAVTVLPIPLATRAATTACAAVQSTAPLFCRWRPAGLPALGPCSAFGHLGNFFQPAHGDLSVCEAR